MEHLQEELIIIAVMAISGVATTLIELGLLWARNRLRRYARDLGKTQEFIALVDEYYEDTALGQSLYDVRKRLELIEKKVDND